MCYIYVITLFRIKSGVVNNERAVGWFKSFEEAEGYVLSNEGDMYEYGEYNVALIEQIHSGFYIRPEETWYAVDASQDQDIGIMEYKIEKCEKPGIFENICGFSMG